MADKRGGIMNAIKFKKWKNELNFTTDDIADIFGLSLLLIESYENEEVPIPPVVSLACDYVYVVKKYQDAIELEKFSSSIKKKSKVINEIKKKILYESINNQDKFLVHNDKLIRSWLNLIPSDYL